MPIDLQDTAHAKLYCRARKLYLEYCGDPKRGGFQSVEEATDWAKQSISFEEQVHSMACMIRDFTIKEIQVDWE